MFSQKTSLFVWSTDIVHTVFSDSEGVTVKINMVFPWSKHNSFPAQIPNKDARQKKSSNNWSVSQTRIETNWVMKYIFQNPNCKKHRNFT